jgi:hypothetical protein
MSKEYRPYVQVGCTFDEYLARHIEWSKDTFGPWDPNDADLKQVVACSSSGPVIKEHAPRDEQGVIDHIEKELVEVKKTPKDGYEWIDIIILAIDGYVRSGNDPDELLFNMLWKQKKNMRREWGDWRDHEPGKAVEHVKGIHD